MAAEEPDGGLTGIVLQPPAARPRRSSCLGKIGFWLSLLPATASIVGTLAAPG